jgi:hypothetical protein
MSDKAMSSNRTHNFLWIVIALLVASLLGTVSLFVRPLLRKHPASAATAQRSGRTPTAVRKQATSFADLDEAEIPGRYRIDDGGAIMHIVLNEDHSFINKDGTTYPPYRWDVLPDRLVITWQRSSSTFTDFEGPGVYSRKNAQGGVMRMAKLTDFPPADAIVVGDKDVVASVRFTGTVEGKNMTLANTAGDGAVLPGDAGGQECHHLVRQRSRMSAYLYARIAPELKHEAFTNALLTVEYFDSPAGDPRNGWISLQYDGGDGPYTSTAQSVKLRGSMKWTRATFVMESPVFSSRENDQADFRLCVANPDLSVRSINLARNIAVQQTAPP